MVKLGDVARVLVGVHLQPNPAGPSRLVRLSNVAEVRAGKPLTLLRVDQPEVDRAQPLEEGDLIATARGARVDACLAVKAVLGAFVTLDLYLIRPDHRQVLPDYLLAVLESQSAQAVLDQARQGSNLPRLPKAALENLPVPLPPMSRQRVVADLHRTLRCEAQLLGELQSKQAIAAAEIMRRAIATSPAALEPARRYA